MEDREDPGVITVCSWCGRVRAGGWVEPEQACALVAAEVGSPSPQLTHGICESCAGELRVQVRA